MLNAVDGPVTTMKVLVDIVWNKVSLQMNVLQYFALKFWYEVICLK